MRDVLTGHTTGVEGTHRELGSRLTDRLRGDDADGLAEIGALAGREHLAVAARAHTDDRLAGEHRADADAVVAVVDGDLVDVVVVELLVARDHRSVGERDVLREATPEQTRVEQAPALRVAEHVLDPDAAIRLAVDLDDDELLRHVDETPREVAGVGRTQRGVGESLPCTVGGDEVLENGEALAEVRLDRPRDDLAARVGDEAAHAGDLTHLHDVSSGARADHHLDRVELLLDEQLLHRLGDLVGRLGPDLDLTLTALVVGDDAPLELALRPWRPRPRTARADRPWPAACARRRSRW